MHANGGFVKAGGTLGNGWDVARGIRAGFAPIRKEGMARNVACLPIPFVVKTRRAQ